MTFSAVEGRSAALQVAVIGAETATSVAQVLGTLPVRSGLAVVVYCHDGAVITLAPGSRVPITEVRGRVRLEPDRVFVVPADCEGSFQRDELVVVASTAPRAPVDLLLRSLAEEHGGHGAGVVLHGRGSDGAIGLRRLKEAGGLTIAQRPESAASDHPVIGPGMVDLVLPLAAIGERLVSLVRAPSAEPVVAEEAGPKPSGELPDTLHDILTLVRIRTGHDFTSYKRATLYRRVARRVQVCQCDSITGYLRHLRDHPDELASLLRDFLISVTNFFRDRAAFEALEHSVIPRLFAGKGPADHVRVWVAGCATGEEAYSIAILLSEHASKLSAPPHLQVFATDIDEDALAEARSGRYLGTVAVDVSPARLERFFTPDGSHVRVTKELRELVLFSPHNVLRDPPFSRLDLVACRNLLIYLNRDGQDRVLNVFHFALRADGLMFLGSSESAENTTMFAALEGKHRLFARRPTAPRPIAESLGSGGVLRWDPPIAPGARPPAVERATAGQLHHQLAERYAPPSVLVDGNLDVVHVSEHAGRWFQLPGGEPTRQLLLLIHPALRLELRTAIHAARQRERRSDSRIVRFEDAGRSQAIELRVRAVSQPELGDGALLVMFDELDASPEIHPAGPAASAALEPVMRELEDELRTTREQLRTTIEQYDTSLEELKASNEELQAINEELRSASEELETSKEELQSVNEELTTLNMELSVKVEEVSHANNDLQNLMTSTDIGVVFLDRELHVTRFTPRAQDVFNLIPGDLGRPLAHVTHRLECDELPAVAQAVLQSLRTVERELRSRDGRRYLARVLPYRSLDHRIGGVVMTFVDVTDLRDAVDARAVSEAALQTSEELLRHALRTTPMLVVGLDRELRTIWSHVLGEEVEPGATTGLGAPLAWLAPEDRPRFTELAAEVLRDGSSQRVELGRIIEGERQIYAFRIERTERGLSVVGFDITASKRAEAALRDADQRKDQFLATLSHELRNPLTPLQVALDVARLAGDDPAQLAQAHAIMERQVAQLGQLVDDLLDLSRVTQDKIALDRVELDPVRVVDAALEATQSLIRQRNHRITVTLPDVAVRVLGDHGRLTQVLTNLLNNAARYTPPRGNLALSVALDQPRRVVVLCVSDDGNGIAPGLLPRIFEIFVQGRDEQGRAHGGLGIGLNLARRLVELHGGRIAASSAGPGRGSTFTVVLPVLAIGSAAGAPA